MKNLKWKLLTIVGVIVFAAVMIYPPFDTPSSSGRISLGLDLKGGVQLVLRVKTDEALQYTSEDAAERLRLALREKNIAGPDDHGARRRRGSSSPACRSRWTRRSAPSPTRSPSWSPSTPAPAAAGGYTFELKPNVAQIAPDPGRRAGAPDRRAPGQRARCLGADRRPLRHGWRPDSGPAARRQRPRPGEAPDRHHGPPRAEDRRGRPGRVAGGAAPVDRRRRAARDGGRHRGRPDQPGLALLLPCAQGGAGHRPRPQQCPRLGRREQPARGRLLHEPGRARSSSATSPARTSASRWP